MNGGVGGGATGCPGGFGGGGAGHDGGGGGGGYAGGGGGGAQSGGGGGSSFFADAVEPISAEATNEGDGFVFFCEIPAAADLVITKEAVVKADGTVAFDLEVENLGPADATDVVGTDELPACTQFQSDDCGGTATDGTWTWELGELAAEDSASCTLTVDASGCAGEGVVTNVAIVAGDQEDPDEGNNSAEAGFEIEGEEPGEADLSIALAATVVGNPTAELQLTAANAGPDAATGVEVALELPECTAFESDTCDGTPTDGEWTWAVGALAADATTACTVTVDILDCEQPPTFTATIAGDPTDPDPANNTAELQLEVEPVPSLPMVALVLLAAALSVVTLHKLRRDRGRSSEQKRG